MARGEARGRRTGRARGRPGARAGAGAGRRPVCEAVCVGARVLASRGLGLSEGRVGGALALARGARGAPERGWACAASAQCGVGRACCARTEARPREMCAADGGGRAWAMMAPSRARRRARGDAARPLPRAGGACGRSGGGGGLRRRSRCCARRGLRLRGAVAVCQGCLGVTGGGARPPARPRASAGLVRTRRRALVEGGRWRRGARRGSIRDP